MPAYVEEYAGFVVQEYRSPLLPPEAKSKSNSNGFSVFVRLKSLFVTVFLPKGFPHTVTEDYVQYQIWDTLQAFASSLSGALSTAAVLKGVGVGNQEATVLAASLTWLLRDGAGMIGRIVFAWAKGSELDSNCKKWRLVADILNDGAHVIDLVAPHFSATFFAPSVCLSSTLRSIVGVAGGATRTAVTRHQALRENLADVAAKDGSQETLVNFVSLLVSLVMLPLVDESPWLVWALSFLFVTFHIFANYRAVRSLKFCTFNQQRLALCVKGFCEDSVPCPVEANLAEPLFSSIGPKRRFGCSLANVMGKEINMQKSLSEPEHGRWIASYSPAANLAQIALRHDATVEDQLEAALIAEYRAVSGKWPSAQDVVRLLTSLQQAGWTLTPHQLDFDEWRFREKSA